MSVEVIFAKLVVARHILAFRIRWLLGRSALLGFLWRLHDNDLEHVPQRADAKHIAGDVKRAAYFDVESEQTNKRTDADQQTSHQPQGKRLVHNLRVPEKTDKRRCDIIWCSPDDSWGRRLCPA